MENTPTITLSYAYVSPEGGERPWSHAVKPMALAVSKKVTAYHNLNSGRRRALLLRLWNSNGVGHAAHKL